MKPLSINPLKTSPALGAAYALQGIKGAIAIFHAAPGCTFLGKVLLTQHLKEPVGLVGTDIKEMPAIMGGLDKLKTKIIDIHKRFKPTLIGIIGTALSEIRGEDIENIITNYELRIMNCKLLYIPCPDYKGGFEDGYAKTVEVIVENMADGGTVISNQINILPSASLTIGDIEEIREMVSTFGLKPIILPDLSLSIDGSKDRYSILPLDGTNIADIKLMGQSFATIAIGEKMRKAGEILRQKFNIPLFAVKNLVGLEATDEFIKLLVLLRGKDIPEGIRRWRKRLIDGMVDTHLIMAEKKIAIGLDGDMSSGITAFCFETGADVVTGYDLEELEDKAQDAHLLITNSHGREISNRLGIPLLRMGFPIYDRFGETFKVRVGYKGSLNLIFEMTNILKQAEEDTSVSYKST